MKNLLLTTLLLLFGMISINAQDDNIGFVRKGRILVESGYSFSFSGVGGNTGLSVISADGTDIFTLGVDGGYFVSEDLAIKVKFDMIDLEGLSLTGIGAGAKYYIGGKLPVEAGFARFSAEGESTFITNISVGYGISLADNINLEPLVGLAINEGETALQVSLKFAMFL